MSRYNHIKEFDATERGGWKFVDRGKSGFEDEPKIRVVLNVEIQTKMNGAFNYMLSDHQMKEFRELVGELLDDWIGAQMVVEDES